jgi:GNAT superfamily N-acetyltransferase
VWVAPGDAAAAQALSVRGHRLDSQPLAMAADLASLRLPAADDLDWYETGDAALVARINDAAYGFPPPAFAAVMEAWREGPWHAYVACLDGRPAGALLACDGDNGDCGISAVATLPAARGCGVATRLLAAVLRGARRRGLHTTSLQANRNGARIYAALGYRNLGAMAMWGRHRGP